MCNWGNDTILFVPIPAELSHTGKFRWDYKGIDSCIAPIVKALNDAGIYTSQSCCGHGKGDGVICLHDGRTLIIQNHLAMIGSK
jgi:hypothetical protein